MITLRIKALIALFLFASSSWAVSGAKFKLHDCSHLLTKNLTSLTQAIDLKYPDSDLSGYIEKQDAMNYREVGEHDKYAVGAAMEYDLLRDNKVFERIKNKINQTPNQIIKGENGLISYAASLTKNGESIVIEWRAPRWGGRGFDKGTMEFNAHTLEERLQRDLKGMNVEMGISKVENSRQKEYALSQLFGGEKQPEVFELFLTNMLAGAKDLVLAGQPLDSVEQFQQVRKSVMLHRLMRLLPLKSLGQRFRDVALKLREEGPKQKVTMTIAGRGDRDPKLHQVIWHDLNYKAAVPKAADIESGKFKLMGWSQAIKYEANVDLKKNRTEILAQTDDKDHNFFSILIENGELIEAYGPEPLIVPLVSRLQSDIFYLFTTFNVPWWPTP